MVNAAQVSTSCMNGASLKALHHGVVMHQDGGLVIADARDRFEQARRQIEPAALPVSRQILGAGFDRAVGIDSARAADADEGRKPQVVFLRPLDQALEHADQAFDGFLAIELFIAVPP